VRDHIVLFIEKASFRGLYFSITSIA